MGVTGETERRTESERTDKETGAILAETVEDTGGETEVVREAGAGARSQEAMRKEWWCLHHPLQASDLHFLLRL